MTTRNAPSGHEVASEASGLTTALQHPSTWLAVAVAGVFALFAGLGIQLVRYERGDGVQALFSTSEPGSIVALVAAMVICAGLLGALSVTALTSAGSVESAVRRCVPLIAAWTGVFAMSAGASTYAFNANMTLGRESEVLESRSAPAGDGLVAADNGAAAHDDSAAHAGAAAHADGVHDAGTHATMTQLVSLDDQRVMAMIPDGLVTGEELGYLRSQMTQASDVGKRLATAEAAQAAGYFRVSADVTAMGEHWINIDYLADNVFDPARPEGLLFSKIDDGEARLVGVWFLQLPGSGGATTTAAPEGFAGDLDVWHGHAGVCLNQTSASEAADEAGCKAIGGLYVKEARWMMHVWVAPDVAENSNGFFAYLNQDLAAKQVASVPLGDGGEF